jgi:hypothetical protein
MNPATHNLLETLAVLRHGSLRQRALALRWLPADIGAWWSAGCPNWCPHCQGQGVP